MEKSTALLILDLTEDQLNKENIEQAYENNKGKFSEGLLTEAKNCLYTDLNIDTEKNINKEIKDLTKQLDNIKIELDEVSEKFDSLRTNYDNYKKDNSNKKSIYVDKETRRDQIVDYINLLNSNADAILNQIMDSETSSNDFEDLKAKRNDILSSIKKYENELEALNYIINKEKNNEFPETLNIVSEQPALEQQEEIQNNIEEEKEEVNQEINPTLNIDNNIENKDDMHEIFPDQEEVKEEQKEENVDFNWNFDNGNEMPSIEEAKIEEEQPVVEGQEVESKGEYTWTFDQKQEQPVNTDIPNDINDYTYEEQPIEDKPTVLKSTGYIITKSYQNNVKENKDYYALQKDNYEVKTKPFSFISKLKDKITKIGMNRKVSSIIEILKEKSNELYKDYLKIEKIKDVMNSLDDSNIQKQAYENLIASIYNGKQNKVDYLEYAASALDDFAKINPNIKEDTQKMIAYELPTELEDYNVEDAIVDSTYQGSLDNPNYTNDVVAFDEFIKNVNSVKRIKNEDQQMKL